MTMKQLFSVLFVSAILHGALSSNLLERANDFACPDTNGYYPADDQCTGIYYLCVNGTAFEQKCPGNSVFDPTIVTCTDYIDASCSTTTTSTTTTTIAPFNCPSQNGLFPVPGTCASDYYVCTDGSSSLATCPSGELFDPVYYECAPMNQTSCDQPFVCPSPNGFFTYPGACAGVYFICVENTSYIQFCPSGSIFDPLLSSCAVIDNASCSPGAPPTTVPTSTTEELTTLGGYVCSADGLFPYEGNCTVYWYCSGGNAVIVPCPSGLVFNPNTGICDFPSNGTECPVANQLNQTGELLGLDAHFRCKGDRVVAHPTVCRRFYTCSSNNEAHLWQCRDSLLFDTRLRICNQPELTDCANRS